MHFSVTHHLILVTTIFMVMLIAGIFLISYTALISGIEETEKEEAPITAEKILAVIMLESDNLRGLAYDWGAWDDTYAFMADSNAQYINSNLQVPSLAGIKVNYILFFDQHGTLVHGVGTDYQNRTARMVSPELIAYLQDNRLVDSESGNKTGILPLLTGPVLIATHSILRSNEEGPSHGTIVIGRDLDRSKTNYLSRYTLYPFTIERKEQYQRDNGSIQENFALTTLLNSTTTITAESPVTDISGNSTFIARMEIPYHSPYNTRVVLLIVILVTGLSILNLAVMLLYYRFYLARYLTDLSHMLDEATATGNMAENLPDTSVPEIVQLSEAAHRITTSFIENRSELHRSLGEIEEAEERWQILFEEANDAMCVGNEDMIINSNLAWERLFNGNRTEIVNVPLAHLRLPHLDDGTDPMTRFISYYQTIPDNESARFDWRVPVKGREQTFDLTIKKIRFRGEVLRYVVARDITLQAMLHREQARIMAQIDENMIQFATLNDEIRNPLTVIAGLTEIDEPEHGEAVMNQIRKIDLIIDRLDKGYLESEKVRRFLKKT
jgi:sensor domain CHASE-containing protein